MADEKMSAAGFETASPPFAIVAKATGAKLIPRSEARGLVFVFDSLPPDFDQRAVNEEIPPIAPVAYITAHTLVYELIAKYKRERAGGR